MRRAFPRGSALSGAIALLLALAPVPASSAEIREPPTVEVVTEGIAAVLVDPVTARDRAIVDAKRAAVEQVVSVEVDSQAVYSMGLSQDDWLRVRSFGFVRRYEVLEELPGADRYRVKLRAWVRQGEGGGKADVREFLSQRSFVLFGEGEGAGEVVARLKDAFVDQGLWAFDEDFVRASSGSSSPTVAAQRVLADFVVRVSSRVSHIGDSYGVKAFQASVAIQASEVSSGQIRAVTDHAARVFGVSKEQALAGSRADQFPKAVADPAVRKFLEKLDRSRVGAAQKVRVALESPSGAQALDALTATVRELMWVQSCTIESLSPDRGVLVLEYPEKIVYLAADLDYSPEFSVTSYGPGYVTVKAER